MRSSRTRADRCPGALRPWPAEDGLLVRLRVPGGNVRTETLLALHQVAERFGDGRVYLTGRANLQIRGLPATLASDALPEAVLSALAGTGLLPSRSHELVRNVLASPQTGLPGDSGGRADLRGMVTELDESLQATPVLAGLPGRFLFVLDDGRGDLVARSCDLGVVALDRERGQLRIGDEFGPVLPLASVPSVLTSLAGAFTAQRGSGNDAAWHVVELPEPLDHPFAVHQRPDPTLPGPTAPPSFGPLPGAVHLPVPEQGWTGADLADLAARSDRVVLTPWRGVLVPTTAAPSDASIQEIR